MPTTPPPPAVSLFTVAITLTLQPSISLRQVHRNLLPPLPHHAGRDYDTGRLHAFLNSFTGNRNVNSTEAMRLIGEDEPAYVKNRPQKRSWLGMKLLGPIPNKHEQLFWFDRKGPMATFYIIQNTLIMNAVYLAIFSRYYSSVGMCFLF